MLQELFCPSSVAVIGASRDKSKVGSQAFHNIRKFGFRGKCYPVNPNASTIAGVKCFPNIKEVPGQVDMAVIAIPNTLVPKTVEDCGRKGIKHVVILTAGFRESGLDGARLEKEILDIASQYDIRVVGPNCLGIINTSCDLNATFARSMPVKGHIAFMSQSGALCTSILDWSQEEKVGFSEFVSLGNKADLDEIDFLKAFEDDPQTRVIAVYLEGINNGIEFMKTAKEISKRKPVIAIKAGTTRAGARAVSSHTGALAGSDSTYNTAFKQSGVIRARSIEELFDFSTCLALQPVPKGRHVAILTNAGGPGIMATDACERKGIPLAGFEKNTIDLLHKALPKAANIYNPVDILGDARAKDYEVAADVLLKDSNIDSLIVILTPQAMTEIEETARAIIRVSSNSKKPILTCFMGKHDISKGVAILRENKLPHYFFPEKAVASLGAMLDYLQIKEDKVHKAEYLKVKKLRVREIIRAAKTRGESITDIWAKLILDAYGINIPKLAEARDLNEACRQAAKIGYPVALKIASPLILHKTDIGGVKLSINNEEELKEAYGEIQRNTKKFMTDKREWNVSIDKMVDGLVEVIIGMARDPQFGPVIMFGLGGVFVEVLEDVAFRIAPFSRQEAFDMVSEIQSYPVLRGIRGMKGVDIESIVDNIMRIAQLSLDFPEITEIDLNPLKVGEKGSTAVDARILLGA